MVDLIAFMIILVLVVGASLYIYKEKKKGRHCIGCPMAGNCAKCRKQAELKKKLSKVRIVYP